jgi:hypothetical protein
VANKYKLISGNGREVNGLLEADARMGWAPILFSSTTPAPTPGVIGPPPPVNYSMVLELRSEPQK